MRVPVKYQKLYFFLEEKESELDELDQRYSNIDDPEIRKLGISLTYDIDNYLSDIKNYGMYFDLESSYGITIKELENDINKRMKKLKEMIK